MLKTLLATAVALTATAALAQNDMAPSLGGLTGGPAQSRAVTFTAVGSYSDSETQRRIDVKGDVDGDGTADAGVLRLNCNGGDLVSGLFSPGAPAGKNKASSSAAFAAGKTFTGKVKANGGATAVTVGADQPDVCEGLG